MQCGLSAKHAMNCYHGHRDNDSGLFVACNINSIGIIYATTVTFDHYVGYNLHVPQLHRHVHRLTSILDMQ
jgi:hypothetical protein